MSPGEHTIYLHSTYAEFPSESLSQMTYKVTVVARPAISIRALPETDKLELSWTDTLGYSLDQADVCGPITVWAPASLEASSLANGVRTVTVTSTATQRYFRLRYQ